MKIGGKRRLTYFIIVCIMTMLYGLYKHITMSDIGMFDYMCAGVIICGIIFSLCSMIV